MSPKKLKRNEMFQEPVSSSIAEGIKGAEDRPIQFMDVKCVINKEIYFNWGVLH